MPLTYLKSAPGAPPQAAADIIDTVQVMLARLRAGGAQVALEYARDLDGWDGPVTLSQAQIAAASARVPQSLKDDIAWAHDNIAGFAAAQRATAQDMEIELRPGLIAGQKQIPVRAAGCYVPGGRYSHIASALMSIATARAAGVADITACSPPSGRGASPTRWCTRCISRGRRASCASAACRGWRRWRSASLAHRRRISSWGPATPMSPRPSGSSSARWGSTWWRVRPTA